MNRLLLILFIGITGIFNNSLQAQTPSLIICKGSNVNYKEFNGYKQNHKTNITLFR